MINSNLIKELKSECKIWGDLPGEWLEITNDSRLFKSNSAFLAFTGAKFNAVLNLKPILENSCPLVIFELSEINNEEVEKLFNMFPKTTFVGSNDLVVFCQQLASLQIKEWIKCQNRYVLGISGSNGKTTHKEMMASMLSEVMPKTSTWTLKNNNNHLGVPLTIFQMTPTTEIVVIELGSNHPGEIKVLCDICHPNCGLVTNIGATHLEFFETEEAVFKEEGYLYWSINENTKGHGLFLQNVDDAYLKSLPKMSGSFTVSSGESDIKLEVDLKNSLVSILEKNNKIAVIENNNIIGHHNFINLADSYLLLSKLFPHKANEFKIAASKFVPVGMRSQWITFKNKKVFLDAYNANPSSMIAALEGFKGYMLANSVRMEDCLIILGDMKELGNKEDEMHKNLGAYLEKLGFSNAAFVGQKTSCYSAEYKGKKMTFSNVDDFKQNFKSWDQYNYYFIKGSRSLQLESILDITYH